METADSTADDPRARLAEHVTEERPRRSCFGCLFTSTLGCGAFFFGTVLAAVLFAPAMLSVPVATLVQSLVNDSIEGQLSIEGLELSWTDRQRVTGVTLLDAEGTEILELSGWLPSLRSLLDGETTQLTVRTDVKFAKIVVGADGVSNLARALGKAGEPWSLVADDFEPRPGRKYELRASLTAVGVQDARTQTEFVLSGGKLVVTHAPGGSTVFEVEGNFGDATEVRRVELVGHLDRDARALPAEVDLTLTLTGLPTPVADFVLEPMLPRARRGGYGLEAFLGGTLTGTVALAGDLSRKARFDARIGAPELEVSGAGPGLRIGGVVSEGTFSLAGEEPSTLTLLVPPGLCEEPIRRRLPASTELTRGGDEPWTLELSSLVLDVGPRPPGESAWDDLLRGSSFDATLRPPGRFELVDRTRGARAALDQVAIALDGAFERELSGRVSARFGPGGGAADMRAVHLGLRTTDTLAAVVAGLADGEQPAFAVDCAVDGLAADSLSVFGVPADWLRDFFGDGIDLRLDVPDSSAALPAAAIELRAGQRRSLVGARIVDGMLRAEDGGRFDLELPLDERLRARILTPLLPWLADLESEGTVRLLVEDFALPLDGDVARVRARLRIELGEVTYRLHAGLRQHFLETSVELAGDAGRLRRERLLPIVVSIENGVVTYEQFTVPLGGEECDLEGTLELGSGEVLFHAEVPMRTVGKQLGVQAKMADFLLRNAVPTDVAIEGHWADPRVMVDVGEVKKIMQSDFARDLALPAFRQLFQRVPE